MMELLFRSLSVSLLIAVCYSQIVNNNFGCGQPTRFTAPNGTIYSHLGYEVGHHYGKNIRCIWTIEAPAGWFVELVAEGFEIESYSSCYHDYLALYDGPYTNYTQLGKFCGSSFLPISSTGRFLTLLFVTQSYTQMNGFKLYYNFTRTPIYSCRSGYFLCADHRCVSTSYRCDGDDDCADDSDEQHCPPFTCRPSYFPCVKERKCIGTSWLCDGGNDCRDGSDEVYANCHGGAWKCGQLNYTGTSGAIMTPNYPSSYPNSMSCQYHIIAPNDTQNKTGSITGNFYSTDHIAEDHIHTDITCNIEEPQQKYRLGTTISFKFATSFHIETDVGCQYDYVAIYEEGSPLPEHKGPFCGDVAPQNLFVNGSSAIIEFNSDKSDQYAGFKVFWTANSKYISTDHTCIGLIGSLSEEATVLFFASASLLYGRRLLKISKFLLPA